MLNGEQSLGITPGCTHVNARSVISTEPKPKGRAYESHIQFLCPDCGAIATIFASGGPVNTGRIVWSWEGVPTRPEKDKSDAAAQPKEKNQIGDPAKGLPGTEMLLLTEELGIKSPPTCGCKSMALQMDRLGLEECRSRISDLKLSIASNWTHWGWKDKLSAIAASAWKAAGLGINPTDPVRDILELALDRAEAKMKELNK